jgi:hypothetical protein
MHAQGHPNRVVDSNFLSLSCQPSRGIEVRMINSAATAINSTTHVLGLGCGARQNVPLVDRFLTTLPVWNARCGSQPRCTQPPTEAAAANAAAHTAAAEADAVEDGTVRVILTGVSAHCAIDSAVDSIMDSGSLQLVSSLLSLQDIRVRRILLPVPILHGHTARLCMVRPRIFANIFDSLFPLGASNGCQILD